VRWSRSDVDGGIESSDVVEDVDGAGGGDVVVVSVATRG
jgi:hypothetical protein